MVKIIMFGKNNQKAAENQSRSLNSFQETEQQYGDDRYDGLLDLMGFNNSEKPSSEFTLSSKASLGNNALEKIL